MWNNPKQQIRWNTPKRRNKQPYQLEQAKNVVEWIKDYLLLFLSISTIILVDKSSHSFIFSFIFKAILDFWFNFNNFWICSISCLILSLKSSTTYSKFIMSSTSSHFGQSNFTPWFIATNAVMSILLQFLINKVRILDPSKVPLPKLITEGNFKC